MEPGLFGTLAALDARGQLILAAIVLTLLASVVFTFIIRSRYAALDRDLSDHTRADMPFSSRVLARIFEDARRAQARRGEVDHQARIEQHLAEEHGGLLLGERFVRAAPGLVIVFGLVGTFYGLSLSIGKLVSLVTGGDSAVTDITSSMTQGLTQALSGMSVAFSTSLFGVAAAVVLTFLGVFFNVSDRRTATIVAIETHLERMLGAPGAGADAGHGDPGVVRVRTAELEHLFGEFAQSVDGLRDAVGRFEAALQGFAANTRDFREFNLHLKDNVQRMSLSFADLSNTLVHHTQAITGHKPR